MFKITGEG